MLKLNIGLKKDNKGDYIISMAKTDLTENELESVEGGWVIKDWVNKTIKKLKNIFNTVNNVTDLLDEINHVDHDLYLKIMNVIETKGIAKTVENVKKIARSLGYSI